MDKSLLGPETEIGLCDSCLSTGDSSSKPVRRIEEDNIYFCRDHWKEHREGNKQFGHEVGPYLKAVN